MINDPSYDWNSWSARKKLYQRSQIAIPFAKWRISNMSDMQFWKPHDFRGTLYSVAFELIMNLTSDFRNSKWRTQYRGHNILQTQRFSWNFVLQRQLLSRSTWGHLVGTRFIGSSWALQIRNWWPPTNYPWIVINLLKNPKSQFFFRTKLRCNYRLFMGSLTP